MSWFPFSAGQDSTTNPNNAGGENWSSSSESSNASSSSWRDPQSVWGGQAPWLENLYGMGQGKVNQGGWAQDRANDLYGKAMQGFDQLMNPGVNPQLQAYQGDVQRNLERNILPGISSQAQGFGQMGSSRQGIAEGLAASDANQQVTDMAANLYSDDMNRMGQAMSMAPGLGAFGQGIPWYAMNQYKGILGDPTVLGGAAGSQSSSSSSGESSSYGYDYDIGGGTDKQGWNLGFGS